MDRFWYGIGFAIMADLTALSAVSKSRRRFSVIEIVLDAINQDDSFENHIIIPLAKCIPRSKTIEEVEGPL